MLPGQFQRIFRRCKLLLLVPLKQLLYPAQKNNCYKKNHLLLREGLEAINPAVANTVTELLFLPVEDMLRVEELQKCQFRLHNTEQTQSI